MARIERREPFQRLIDLDLVWKIGGLQTDPDAVFERADRNTRIEPQHLYFASGSRPEAFKNLDCRGLTRAVRPQQTEHLARRDLEIDSAHGLKIAIGFVEVADLDGGFHSHYSKPCWQA